jgi:type II secretory pathway pseudopilin PulG
MPRVISRVRRTARGAGRRCAGFTLLEVLVALGVRRT